MFEANPFTNQHKQPQNQGLFNAAPIKPDNRSHKSVKYGSKAHKKARNNDRIG